MCFLLSLLPATFWVVIGYFVLFSSAKAGGRDKNLWSGLSDLDFCDCGVFSGGWCLRHARWSLSRHLKIAFVDDV